jgi:hypothetical protein
MGAAAASTSSSNSDEAFAAIARGTWGLGADVGADVAPWRVTFDSPADFGNNSNATNSASEHGHYHSGAEHEHNSSSAAGTGYDLSQQQLQQQQQQQQYSCNNNNDYAAAAAEQLNPRDAAIARAGARGALPPAPAVHRAGVETGLAGYSGVRTAATGTSSSSSATSSGDGSLPFGLQAVVRKLRTAVTGTRGVRGIAGLQKALRSADSDSDGRVTLAEFKHALHTTLSTSTSTSSSTSTGGNGSNGNSSGGLSGAELRMLHAHFDTDGCGSCAAADIAAAVRVPLQHRRAACVRAAFSKLQLAAVAAAGAAGTGAYLTGLGLVDATAVVR